jgi:formate dehydrogenase subunit gamma
MVCGGDTISRELHPWFGVLFAIAVVLMYRMWSREMKETPQDKIWWQNIGHYIRNEDEKMPSADRFNPGQKLLFWGFFVNGIVLLITGVILWFPESMPLFLRGLAGIVHAICALLTIGLFIIHVYMGTAMERGAFGSVIRGDVSRAWAAKHHRTWFEQILRGSTSRR